MISLRMYHIFCFPVISLLLSFVFLGSSLHLRFVTRSGRPRIDYQWGDDRIEMRGFKAKYTFSDEFVNLGEGSFFVERLIVIDFLPLDIEETTPNISLILYKMLIQCFPPRHVTSIYIYTNYEHYQ